MIADMFSKETRSFFKQIIFQQYEYSMTSGLVARYFKALTTNDVDQEFATLFHVGNILKSWT